MTRHITIYLILPDVKCLLNSFVYPTGNTVMFLYVDMIWLCYTTWSGVSSWESQIFNIWYIRVSSPSSPVKSMI